MTQQSSHPEVFYSDGVIIDLYDKLCFGDYSPKEIVPICSAILYGQEPFNDEYEKFAEYVSKITPKMTCGSSWSKKKLTIHCMNCEKSPNSCVCLKCILDGNHDGHDLIIRYSENASCDCGDESLWKKEGFCSHHPGSCENPDRDNMGSDLRSVYLTIFAVLCYHLPKVMEIDNDTAKEYLDWMRKNQSLGDSVRRCLCIVLAEMTDIAKITDCVLKVSPQVAESLASLYSDLSNDRIFRNKISVKIIKTLIPLTDQSEKLAEELTENKQDDKPWTLSLKLFSKCLFHCFTESLIPHLMEEIDLPEFFVNLIKKQLKLGQVAKSKHAYKQARLGEISSQSLDLLRSNVDNSHKIRFFELLADALVDFDGANPEVRKFGDKADDFTKTGSIAHEISFTISQTTEICEKEKFFIPHVFDAYVEWLKKHEIGEYKCVLEPNVPFSFALDLHIFVSRQLMLSGDPEKWLQYMADKSGRSLEQLTYDMALLPLKLFVSSLYAYQNMFARNPDSVIISLISFNFKSNIIYRFIPCFNIIQYCAEFCPNKEQFMTNVATVFGIFSQHESLRDVDAPTEFLYLALCLAIDRVSFSHTPEEVVSNIINVVVRGRDCPFEEIDRYLPQYRDNGKTTMKVLPNLTSKVISGDREVYRSSPAAQWTMLSPWLRFSLIRQLITTFSEKNKDTPFPLPIQEGHPLLLELMDTSIVRAIVLLQLASGKLVESQLANSYFIVNSTRFSIKNGQKHEFVFESLESVHTSLSIDYASYLSSSVTIGDKTVCAVDELQKSSLGKNTLVKMGFETSTSESERDEQRRKNKLRALAAKQKALSESANSQRAFELNSAFECDDEVEEAEAKTCSVCQNTNEHAPLFYPAFVYQTVLPSIIEGDRVLRPVPVFKMCQHYVHEHCIKHSRDGMFKCPLDRSVKNCLIPIIEPSLTTKLARSDIVGLDSFLDAYVKGKFTKCDGADTLGSMLAMLDASDRINPNILESATQQLLMRTLFTIFWSIGDSEDESTLHMSPASALVYRVIASEDPVKAFREEVPHMYSELKREQRLSFIRRAGIFEKFVISSEKEQFFDWDEFLDHENLCRHFGIDETEFDIAQPIRIIQAPENIIDLLRPPFNEDELTYDVEAFYCLYNKELVKRDALFKYLSTQMKGTYAPFIRLTGKFALKVQVADVSTDKFIDVPPLYKSYLGQVGYGWTLSDPIRLDKENLLKLEQTLLTGDFYNNLN